MASLVADYGSSEGESDGEAVTREKEDFVDVTATTKNNYLLAADDNSSSEESAISTKDVDEDKLPNPFSEQLPAPVDDDTTTNIPHLVFTNPFKEEQCRKNSILEQHVKMTESPSMFKANKQVCWKFRRGKCRFGKNCRFSHDVDNHIETTLSSNAASPGLPAQYTEAAFLSAIEPWERAVPEDEETFIKRNKKKRPGVSDSLVPPKRAMMALDKQRAEERPWTVKS